MFRLLSYRLDAFPFGERVGELIAAALRTHEDPYAAYPPVGAAAALLTEAGNVFADRTYPGAFPPHAVLHARTAKMIAGDRSSVLAALVLEMRIRDGGHRPRLVLPCGACRHFLAADAPKDGAFHVIGWDCGQLVAIPLGQLLPYPDGDAGFDADLDRYLPPRGR